MKKIDIKKQLSVILLTSFMMVGCGQVAPSLGGDNHVDMGSDGGFGNSGGLGSSDNTNANGSNGTTQIGGDTVTIDENKYGNSGIGDGKNGTSNGQNGSRYNSSVDGFKSIYFDFGRYNIASKMDNNMRANHSVATRATTKIKIEGNCDEFGTDEYNYALGLKRAKAVKDSLAADGVNVSRMILVSYGESSPVCNEPTDGCYDRNRRVDLRLVK